MLADTTIPIRPVNSDNSPKSTMNPASARARAWRKTIGPPSVRTTRSPIAYFPGERPRVSVSHSSG